MRKDGMSLAGRIVFDVCEMWKYARCGWAKSASDSGDKMGEWDFSITANSLNNLIHSNTNATIRVGIGLKIGFARARVWSAHRPYWLDANKDVAAVVMYTRTHVRVVVASDRVASAVRSGATVISHKYINTRGHTRQSQHTRINTNTLRKPTTQRQRHHHHTRARAHHELLARNCLALRFGSNVY